MESNDKLKEIDIKNCTCYYFNNIIKIDDFDFDNVKSYKNILVHDISYKTLIGAKPFDIRFDKRNEFIRVYNGARYLVLFGLENYDPNFYRIGYIIGVKSGITYVISHYYGKIKVDDSYNSLPLEKKVKCYKKCYNTH